MSEADSFEVLSASFKAGVNFIDTADMYSRWVDENPGGVSETIIGKWMKQRGIPRTELMIATKVRGRMGVGPNDEGLSRKHIFDSVEGSLQRLQIETIDLYQTHWPDEETPIDETLRAMDDLVRQGKVRYIGCSNYPAWRLMQALWSSDRLDLSIWRTPTACSRSTRSSNAPSTSANCQQFASDTASASSPTALLRADF